MKRLLLLGVGSALMFTMGGVGPAQADTSGSTHKSSAALASETQLVSVGGGRCASCHRAHTAKAEKLLKEAQPALCYSCHADLGSNLDVVDGQASGVALRGGGFEYASIDGAGATKTMPAVLDKYAHPESNLVPVLKDTTGKLVLTPVTSRHQIDGTTQGTMWGNGAVSANIGGALDAGKTGVTLECGSCHDPHGNGNYRILRPVPNDASTTASAGVLAVVVAPVNIPDVPQLTSDGKENKRVYTTDNYWTVADRQVPTTTGGPLTAIGTGTNPVAGSTTYSTDGNGYMKGQGGTDGYITNVAAWCTTCHTRYLAGSGSHSTPLTSGTGATLTTDATFTYRHRSDAADKEGVNRPNCIQCHVSHGSNVAMSAYRARTFTAPDGTTPAPAGTPAMAVNNSRLLRVDNRGTCEMCHNV